MPALTTPHAFPAAERHKTCTTHFGEPREEEVQQYRDCYLLSGPPFHERMEMVQACSTEGLGKLMMAPLEPLIAPSLSLPGIQINQHPLLEVDLAVSG